MLTSRQARINYNGLYQSVTVTACHFITKEKNSNEVLTLIKSSSLNSEEVGLIMNIDVNRESGRYKIPCR